MLIVVGSVTTATRLSRLLERRLGVPAGITRTPSAIKRGGCSYSVRVTGVSADAVRREVSEFGFKINGIYTEEASGGEREYRDIS